MYLPAKPHEIRSKLLAEDTSTSLGVRLPSVPTPWIVNVPIPCSIQSSTAGDHVHVRDIGGPPRVDAREDDPNSRHAQRTRAESNIQKTSGGVLMSEHETLFSLSQEATLTQTCA